MNKKIIEILDNNKTKINNNNITNKNNSIKKFHYKKIKQ